MQTKNRRLREAQCIKTKNLDEKELIMEKRMNIRFQASLYIYTYASSCYLDHQYKVAVTIGYTKRKVKVLLFTIH
jgi:hypothetical protein